MRFLRVALLALLATHGYAVDYNGSTAPAQGEVTASSGAAAGYRDCDALTSDKISSISGSPSVGSCGSTISHGSTCALRCGLGYQLDGNAWTCYDGTLQYNGQLCYPDVAYAEGYGCVGLLDNDIANRTGTKLGSCGTSVADGSFCNLQCHDGYELVGEPFTCRRGVLTDNGQQCKAPDVPGQGEYEVPLNACKPITQANITTIPGAAGAQLGECAGITPSGGKCAIRCGLGYQLDGNAWTCYNGVLSYNGQRCSPNPVYGPGLGCEGLYDDDIAGIPGALLGMCGTSVADASWCNIGCRDGWELQGDPYTCAKGVLTAHGQRCVPKSGASNVTYTWAYSTWSTCSKSCGYGVQSRTVTCMDNRNNTVDDALCGSAGQKPSSVQLCVSELCQWSVSSWSTCSTACGAGIQTRSVSCTDSSGSVKSDSDCSWAYRPVNIRSCIDNSYCGWSTGDYSECDPVTFRAYRTVHCADGDGNVIGDQYCSALSRPNNVAICYYNDRIEGGILAWRVTAAGICTDGKQSYDVVCQEAPLIAFVGSGTAYGVTFYQYTVLPDSICEQYVAAKPNNTMPCNNSGGYCQ